MPKVTIDGIKFDAEEGWTILEVARFLGLQIPTLCYQEGLSPWGGCRLCIVEIGTGERTKLVTSCTYPVDPVRSEHNRSSRTITKGKHLAVDASNGVEEGLVVKTSSKRVVEARKMILELLISQCSTSKTLQDMAAKMGLKQVRFKPKWEKCIYCGLCVRICEEQMMAKAIGFVNRGNKLKINTPFNKTSDECRRCGACMYVCPACTSRCEGPEAKDVLCGRCENSLQPTCTELNDSYNCWMGLKGECGTCVTTTKK